MYTHPSGECDESGAVLVGNTSPVTYTVTADDVTSGSITFACDVGSHCESGMIQTFTVNRDCVGAWDMGEGECTAACEARTYSVTTAASVGGTACGVADGLTTDCQPGMVRQGSLDLVRAESPTHTRSVRGRERVSRHRATASRAPPSPPSLLQVLAPL